MHPLKSLGRFVGVLASGALLIACGDPHFKQITTAPPTKLATLNDDSDHLEVSRGVAVGLECFEKTSRPCEDVSATVGDENIAMLRRAYVDALDQTPNRGSTGQRRVVYVVVGKQAGTTTLSVDTAEGSFDVEVEVR